MVESAGVAAVSVALAQQLSQLAATLRAGGHRIEAALAEEGSLYIREAETAKVAAAAKIPEETTKP